MSKKMFFVDENGNPYPEVKNKSLGAIAERVTRKNKDNFSERNLTISGELGLIDQLDYFTKNVSSKDNSGYYLLEKGEFAYNKSYSKYSPAGATKKLHRYDFGAVSPLYICFKITSHEEVYADYLEHFFETPIWGKELMSIAVEGARNHGLLNVAVPDFFTLRVPLPSFAEQQKIAEFFSALDERIGLTTDKVKLLKEQKQSYLQKVFAQEMVFTEDSGDRFAEWEQKKIGEVASLRNGYAFDSKSYQEKGTYLVTTISNVTGARYVDSSGSKRVVKVPSDIRKHQVLKVGDILISLTGNVGRVSVVNESNLLLNQRVGLIDPNSYSLLNKDFLYQVLSNEHFLNAMVGSGQGAAQKNIKKEDVENYVFGVPSLPEQEKIAEFFSALDEQIELTESKLSLLKEQKKGYLQGIFG